MAERRPLVHLNGRIAELPSGDTTPGAGSSGNLVTKYSISGPLAVHTGILRWYPEKSVTISAVYFCTDNSDGVTTTEVDVKKNGTSIFTTTPSGNGYKSSVVSVSISMVISDYITVDVVQAGQNITGLTVCIVYS